MHSSITILNQQTLSSFRVWPFGNQWTLIDYISTRRATCTHYNNKIKRKIDKTHEIMLPWPITTDVYLSVLQCYNVTWACSKDSLTKKSTISQWKINDRQWRQWRDRKKTNFYCFNMMTVDRHTYCDPYPHVLIIAHRLNHNLIVCCMNEAIKDYNYHLKKELMYCLTIVQRFYIHFHALWAMSRSFRGEKTAAKP